MTEAARNRRAFLRTGLILAGTPVLSRAFPAAEPPIPRLDRWRSLMIEHGKRQARALSSPAGATLDATFYDAERVFLQIDDFLGDRSWWTAADRALAIYREGYVLKDGGKVPGYWIFPNGLAMHYLRTKDPKSRDAVVLMSRNAAFAGDDTPAAATRDVGLSREVAYNIHNLMKAEEVGEPGRPRLRLLVDQALGHVDQWFVSRTEPYRQPFMFGLTGEALIAYHAGTGDSRIPEVIRIGADWPWDNARIGRARAFRYVDRAVDGMEGPDPAPDVNLPIAPAYARLYRITRDPRHRERGEAIFAGGVDRSWLGDGKHFNQNCRWSFDFVRWRLGGGRASFGVPARSGPLGDADGD